MAHFHTKRKKGRPYLYVREIARVGGKPKVVNQIYIGSPQKVAQLAKGGAGAIKLRVEEFGALWLANKIDQRIDLAGIVDSVIPRDPREGGPSIGEYFLYCVLNRMCEATSKSRLSEWYAKTAINSIRPIALDQLTSQRYWDKWDRVSDADLKKIATVFFEAVCGLTGESADCLLFDTTNYYTFMASKTPSELAKRGKNKEGRNNLRQVGLGLLVSRDKRLPLNYCVYPGNLHDSRQFQAVLSEMFVAIENLCRTKERLTLVIDKGMNSADNFRLIDEHQRVHFVTSYSTYFEPDLAALDLKAFEPLDTKENKQKPECDRILVYRTTGEYWDKTRTVVVTYNPRTARKQAYSLTSKLDTLRDELLTMRQKVREGAPHWKNPDKVRRRYLGLCEHLHLPSDLYSLEFKQATGGLTMSFRKDVMKVKAKLAGLGKNIIITDNTDWTTSEIVRASLDRWQVENAFRQSKDDDLVAVRPIRHFTDSKISCHLFSCVAALTYLRLIELELKAHGTDRTAGDVMDDMRHLHSILILSQGKRAPERRLEIPTKTQAEVLSAFGHHVDDGGVLRQNPA